MALAEKAREAILATPRPIEPPVPLPSQWRDLLGLYDDPALPTPMRLEWRDGRLTVIDAWGDTAARLTATDRPDVFLIDPHVRDAGERCEFGRTADGRVATMRLGPQLLRRLAPVEER